MAIKVNGFEFYYTVIDGNAVVKCGCGDVFDRLGDMLLVDIGDHVMYHLGVGIVEPEMPPLEEPNDMYDSPVDWEPPGYDPGPQVDDEGGMSEHKPYRLGYGDIND